VHDSSQTAQTSMRVKVPQCCSCKVLSTRMLCLVNWEMVIIALEKHTEAYWKSAINTAKHPPTAESYSH